MRRLQLIAPAKQAQCRQTSDEAPKSIGSSCYLQYIYASAEPTSTKPYYVLLNRILVLTNIASLEAEVDTFRSMVNDVITRTCMIIRKVRLLRHKPLLRNVAYLVRLCARPQARHCLPCRCLSDSGRCWTRRSGFGLRPRPSRRCCLPAGAPPWCECRRPPAGCASRC